MKILIFALLIPALTPLPAAHASPPGDSELPFERAVVVLSQTVTNADQIEIYEGLSRDATVAASQKRANHSRQITDQWFYSESDEIRAKHAVKLQRLIEGGLFRPWRDGKLCGGFHADYAIALTFPKVTYYVLFCFTCHEARFVREGNPFAAELQSPDFRVTMDINDKAFEDLRSLLIGYHKPERDSGTPGS